MLRSRTLTTTTIAKKRRTTRNKRKDVGSKYWEIELGTMVLGENMKNGRRKRG